ncbi:MULTISPECIES: MBOAT family O-acyltransferase [Idiomarina]|uniref:MBOAT family O-acyltransferase n=1 Tax=Idiomarina TaxID=135575 RepID=UPI00129C9DCD|nr:MULTISPECIES: MBOAT family O-acyltransferase [Idiomarina]MRJ42956.1 hypothetical protein [Idiomarina sp. FeN1]NCU58508.1 hypothetical protein [Idiomarina sp. FenA--70]NCU61205.1 hypothetical protein [Idiomarina sp. FenBw--71]UUN12705.1 MBOAT family protein [Idiomarina loihiensis]
MSFHNVEYFLLLIFSASIYFITPFRLRWLLLLIVSYFFYGYSQLDFIWLLLVSTFIDYSCGLSISKTKNKRQRRLFLIVSIITNLSILAYFKYRLLIDETLGYLLETSSFLSGPAANFILPIGISFFTLQSMGYTIDVYRGKKAAERHLGYFALYVAYFPQLIAGPIERANKLLPQLKRYYNFDWERIRSGLILILVGLFKKLVIVGNLSPLMDTVYGNGDQYTWLEATATAGLSMFYVYMDFSSYTDIARGSARIYGVNLTENFNRPFSALSVRDFWQRWHISLTRWIFDYLHQPLASLSENSYWRFYLTIITFTIVGLWHGAAFNFILWGFVNGVFIVVEKLFYKQNLILPKNRLWDNLRKLRTFCLVNLGAVIFLSPSVEHAGTVFLKIVSFQMDISISNYAMVFPLLIAGIASASWFFSRKLVDFQKEKENWPFRNPIFRWACYLIIIIFIANFSAPDQNAFIYFQF